MLKILIEDLIEEVQAEILCYEDEDVAKIWVTKFTEIVEKYGERKPYIKRKGNKTYYVAKDESEIFSMADNYVASLESGQEDEYWKGFN